MTGGATDGYPGSWQPSARLARAFDAIDAANAGDPVSLTIDGVAHPKEQYHAALATAWVRYLDPDATEIQLVAARAHHVQRWRRPRSEYPDGRAGYLRWRAEAKRAHAATVAEILGPLGFDAAEIEAVGAIITKTDLRGNDAVQVHEDALCLVFLQTQLGSLAADLGDERTITVLRRTLKKMSPRGAAEAAAIVGLGPPPPPARPPGPALDSVVGSQRRRALAGLVRAAMVEEDEVPGHAR